MNAIALASITGAIVAAALPQTGQAQEARTGADQALETRVWLDRGVDPVFEFGDQANVYYRASTDAYLLLFHVNTDGVLRLLFPGGSEEGLEAADGGRDYRLDFPESDRWMVEEAPGVGYFFVLASREPFSFDRLSEVPVGGGWDSTLEGSRIVEDPYVVVDDFRRVLLPEGLPSEYAIDFTAYHVGQPYSYPRFICYQCHLEQPFEQWNPYLQTCLDVRVVIFNDPYYYPATRYRGDRVVYARPPQPGLPQFAFAPRRLGEAGTPVVQSRVADTGPSRSLGQAPGVDELHRNVDQTGIPSSGDAPLRGLVPSDPDRRLPAARAPEPPPTVRDPLARPGAASSRPTLRRRNERAPAPR